MNTVNIECWGTSGCGQVSYAIMVMLQAMRQLSHKQAHPAVCITVIVILLFSNNKEANVVSSMMRKNIKDKLIIVQH